MSLKKIASLFAVSFFLFTFFSFANATGEAPALEGNLEIAEATQITEKRQSKGGRWAFILQYEPTALTGEVASFMQYLKEEQYLDMILKHMEEEVWLPYDIPITFKDCEEANAMRMPESKEVIFCHDLIQEYAQDYDVMDLEASTIFSGATKTEILAGTTLFILAHELAHGFVDLFNIPITGREEDAVDQFATLLLANADEEGDLREDRLGRFALYGAYFFKQIATDPKHMDRTSFADEHALGQQRYYDVMCLVYGSDPDFYEPIFTNGAVRVIEEIGEENLTPEMQEELQKKLGEADQENILPFERAARCSDEYLKYSNSREYLLENFTKTPSWQDQLKHYWFQLRQYLWW